jgi:hypothetical protein
MSIQRCLFIFLMGWQAKGKQLRDKKLKGWARESR